MNKNINTALTLSLLVFTMASGRVGATGFDCQLAGNKIEKMICSDEELSSIDEWLNKVFNEKKSDPLFDKGALIRFQREFIKERNQCTSSRDTHDCIYKRYSQALNDYRSMPKSVDPDTVELDQSVARTWGRVQVDVDNKDWPYSLFFYMKNNGAGFWYESPAYLMIQDKITGIAIQAFYLPRVFVSTNEGQHARVRYNQEIDNNTYVYINNPDSVGRPSIVISCGDEPRYTYYYHSFELDKITGKFVYKAQNACNF